jgi:hypothetical protein|tara:strand:- start:4568 stop:4903 length:336 start_codon:yes stop_codon:yes gene_type:complete
METLIWILAAYGMSQILVFGSIFDKTREWITKHSTFLGDLLECMMCTSTWVGFFFSIAFYSPTISMVTIPYSNIFFDGMLASGSVWAINAVVEWFEENKPPKNDDQGPGVV